MLGSDRQGDRTYDVIVVGGGSTGENVAERAAAGGLAVVVVEAELVGGECSYWACMPSKALLRPGAALREAQAVDGSRQAATGHLDPVAVLARRDSFTSHWHDDGQVDWLTDHGIHLMRGQGRLIGERLVAVTDAAGTTAVLAARHAVALCTGSKAVVPSLPGIADAGAWTPREATSARQVPGRLVVIGGGVVGCEMATAWRSLGSDVTMVVRGDALLERNEPFAGELVRKSLEKAGVQVLTGRGATSVHRDGAAVTVRLDDGTEVVGDDVLFAVGREPRTEDLGLDAVGLTPGGWLDVDDSCQVTAADGSWLYAAGDVNHRALLTHMGKYQGRVCGDVIAARARGEELDARRWGKHVASADHDAVPQVIFTDPEVAAVGLTESDAVAKGLRVRAVEYELGNVAGASLQADGYSGVAKVVVDEDRRVVVGCTFVGAGVAELLHAATVAVVGEVPIERLWHAVPSYPTMSEIWLRLWETYGL